MVQAPVTAASNSVMRASLASGTTSNATLTRGKPPINGNANNPAAAPLPLSAMHSPPLDLASVERRGQPTASRESSKRIRPHGLEEAPTYKPTEEEFKDPLEYMKKIAPEASKYGICKIIPPDSWKPDFAIDTQRFHFRTRKQELNSVEGSTRANLTYLDQLAKFHKQHGMCLNRFPSVDKRPLDLFKLKKAVETRGGFEKVCKLKKWAEIGRDLGYSGKIMSSLSTSLKNSYQRWLFPYEEYLRLAKPGVHQQLEFEYGGPLTPSPANSPMKKSHQNTPSSLRGESPAVRASDALNASMRHDLGKESKHIPMLDSPAPTPPPQPQPAPVRSGFTPVNAGFTPVNAAPATFTPVHVNRRDREEPGFTPPRRPPPFDAGSAKHPPEYKPSALSSAPVVNGFTSNPMLKRQRSVDSIDSRSRKGSQPLEEGDNGGRRSKRLQKDAVPTVAGSHMTLFRPTPPRIPGDRSTAPGERCEHCGKIEVQKNLLICESCDNGYHMQCLDPQVTVRPDYDWNCPRCLVGDGQFGFEEGGIYSLKQFQEKAADFKEGYFQNKMPFDPVLNFHRPVTEDDIEREFWRLVASLEETVEVEYGADIHSTTHGSGFPTIEKNPQDPYSTDPWNLNIMPYHPESLFRHIKSDISGMTVPWLYVGMIFSTFCWHNEDHYAYSANYQHFGSTKTWYGIPGEDAENFEKAMHEAVPELFETQPDLLFQLVTLLTPEQLKKANVRVYALDQRAGQFVVTFPQAYHAGFNHGFNFNEAVNFAPKDWEPFGDMGVERLQQFRRQPCFSHDELLWTAAEGASSSFTIQTAKWLAPALDRLQKRELAQRKLFLDKHKAHGEPCVLVDPSEVEGPKCVLDFVLDEEDVPEEEYQCSHCMSYAYLSRFKCDTSGKVLCMLHAGSYECCGMLLDERYAGKNHTLHYRRTADAIETLHNKVAEKARQPDQWEEKVETLLADGPTPPLKALRTLLNEGERIPYALKSLATLRPFVERCNEWVEEATSYTARKQQNRRKNEKAWRKGSKAAEMEERDRELRKVENIKKLLTEADHIGFDCSEITVLRERADSIDKFQRDARAAISNVVLRQTQEFERLLELGRDFNVDMPEIEKLDKIVQQMKWNDRARDNRGQFLALHEVQDLIDEGVRLEIPAFNDYLHHYKEQRNSGLQWEIKAKELVNAEVVHYPQLEALSNQAQAAALPVSPETLASVDQILSKQREALKQIGSLCQRSKDEDFTNRPKYVEVRLTMEQLTELNSKPNGTLELEKEQKRHEDWMRKGKKLFGKANAPLHILRSHMEYVLERNLDCFDINSDKPRLPAEPASREPSPSEAKVHSWEDPRFREVFCICRRIEAGMMIECELCHEWYHGKCLKIARGKVKDDEKYTCPICDWRVKIPRDAARPKLEDLQSWQDEIPSLPFQPDEEEILNKIIDNAQEFRNHVSPFCNPVMATADESETQRFYLRKIEGAEILLAYETNFFRQELHKWSPVAPQPPPVLESSKSTRKPRPTKLQKLMAQHGVEDPDKLPQNLRTKPHTFKRKSSEPSSARTQILQPAPGRSDSGTPTSRTFSIDQTMHHGPILSGISPDHTHAHPFGGYGAQDSVFSMSSQHATSPAFAPHAFMHGNDPSVAFGQVISPRAPGMFNEAGFNRMGTVALVPGSNSPVRDSFGGHPNSGADVAQMFNDLTNVTDESGQDKMAEAERERERRNSDTTKWGGDEDMELFFDGP
ncbi:PLU-1-like protein-domain-containing protein [Amylocarpus encephaloides]|uniref:PLU-1-like protein-domain-containing protein n=1 Tax=Amylocarpus encephaloides TaxID=45428 RepID=A0A9P7YMX4_9HELO|nr:PLU-1-like protein-domain-containing protein [Amylocarpus encephaloides]